jgi:hypothetical protein
MRSYIIGELLRAKPLGLLSLTEARFGSGFDKGRVDTRKQRFVPDYQPDLQGYAYHNDPTRATFILAPAHLGGPFDC